MSFFQLYDFRVINRTFTSEEKKEIGTWSSRVKLSSNRAVFTYSYGDFPKDEETVMLNYFDAMLYTDSGNTRRLMFCFPLERVNRYKILQYADDEQIVVSVKGNQLLLEFNFEDEGGGSWIDEDTDMLSDLLPLYNAILNGDYSCLFLAWLQRETSYDDYEDDEEDDDNADILPPMPYLSASNTALESFANFIELDPFLLKAAAEISGKYAKPPAEIDLKAAVAKLPEAVKNDYLLRLLDEEPFLSNALLNEIKKTQKNEEEQPKVAYSVQAILDRAAELRTIKLKKDAAAKEALRQEKIKNTKQNEADFWQQISTNAASAKATGYDKAVQLIADLYELAKEENTVAEFKQKIKAFKEEFKSVALRNRLEKLGL